MSDIPPAIPSRDAEHLRLIEIFHYVVGGFTGMVACIPIIHLLLGVFMLVNPDAMAGNQGEAPAAFIGYLFAGIGLVLVVGGWTMALCIIFSGRMIGKRRNRMFSIVIAAFQCLMMPFGTVLGVFTLVLLTKDSVIRLYQPPA